MQVTSRKKNIFKKINSSIWTICRSEYNISLLTYTYGAQIHTGMVQALKIKWCILTLFETPFILVTVCPLLKGTDIFSGTVAQC